MWPPMSDLTTRKWLIAGALATAAVHVAMAIPNVETAVDDAFISARYAAHLADGHGLVFSAGEPPVEGYTNLAWVVFLAFGLTIGAPIHQWMTWGGLAFGVLGIGLSFGLSRHLIGRDHPAALIAPALLALSPHYAVVVTNGLESALFIASLLGAIWALLATKGRWRLAAGCALGFLALVRPEGLVIGALAIAYDAWKRPRELGFTAGPVLVTWASLESWRWFTYGAWVPNTFAAKSSLPLHKLLNVNLTYTHLDGVYWYVPAVGLLVLPWIGARKLERFLLAGCALALVAIAWRVNLWMPGARLFVPAFALVCCLTAAVIADGGRARNALGIAALAASLAIVPTKSHHFVRNYDRVHSVTSNNGAARAASFLARNAPEGSWMAIRDAGVVAFWAGTKIRVAEMHNRALTLPHPDGRDTDLRTHVPPNPTIVVLTQARQNAKGVRYPGDRLVFQGLTEPYTYLGRVLQHHHRYYDIYVRKDAGMPPLPKKMVVNFEGPEPELHK